MYNPSMVQSTYNPWQENHVIIHIQHPRTRQVVLKGYFFKVYLDMIPEELNQKITSNELNPNINFNYSRHALSNWKKTGRKNDLIGFDHKRICKLRLRLRLEGNETIFWLFSDNIHFPPFDLLTYIGPIFDPISYIGPIFDPILWYYQQDLHSDCCVIEITEYL